MKLLFVHERFGAMAGAEVNALLTASELKNRGHSVAILHGPGTGNGEDRWRETFSPCYPLVNGTKANQAQAEACGYAPAGGTKTIPAALEEFRPDVIYVHKMADLAVLEALVNCGRPLVRMVHDHEMYCLRHYKYNPLTRRICTRAATPYCIFPCGAPLMRNRGGGLPFKWVSYRAKLREIKLNQRFQRMIVATQYMREELERNHFDPAKIEILAPVPRALEVGLQSSFSDRNLIIYSGQIIRGKGVDVLLESLARVQLPFECIILGEGSARPKCEELNRKLGLSGRIHFKGFIAQEELRGYYSDASLTVMSSVWPEPFGAVGLEGMRYGLPVIAFDAGGIKEWLIDGHNGFLVPWMDRGKFAARIEQLLRNKALARQMGERGRRVVRQKYDFSQYVQNLEKLFAKVMSQSKTDS